MTATYYTALNRPGWGGANSDVDIHLEQYYNDMDTRFQYAAIFLGLSQQRSVDGMSNTLRIDRLKSGGVKGRRTGEKLEETAAVTDKMLIVVDTVLYIRNPIDYQDQWTAPDYLSELSENNGSEFAETFDQAHLIQLVKARNWEAPAHLKPAFNDGIEIGCTVDYAATAQADLEANAISINLAHKAGVDELITRKIPLTDMVTLVSTDIYSMLVEHPKLLNLDFAVNNADGYRDRRVVKLNGVPVVECTEFVTTAGTHPLGSAFTTSADDVKCKMVTFSKRRTLVTVEAQPFTTRFWDDEREFCNVLDCYAMYTVGTRRPDTCAVVKFTAAT